MEEACEYVGYYVQRWKIEEAIEYLGRLGGPKRAPSNGPPGVKTIWIGLMKLYILLAYRECLV